jgi:hypothetical protein
LVYGTGKKGGESERQRSAFVQEVPPQHDQHERLEEE